MNLPADTQELIATVISRVVTLLIAFTIHELAHAVVADRMGDHTARYAGRITLNPIKHLDPVGSLMLIVAGFGWAKPVPVNINNLRGNPRTGFAIVAIAGPLSNILMALIAAIPFRLGLLSIFDIDVIGILPNLSYLFWEFLFINVILAVFNMIPIPPLDGSRIMYAILPADLAYSFMQLERYGFLILMAIIFIPSFIPGVPDIIGNIIGGATNFIVGLLLGIPF
jgi:Zn-dependent protease